MNLKINIPKAANELIHTLQDNGHSAYVVGGCVRDSILGREPNDWDICTSATPNEMLEIFKDKKIIETGLQHGTVTVIVNEEPFEITTYRIDGEYSDNRRPDSVTFTDKLKEDLSRRDFTINAMAYNDNEGLIDYFNGLSDIQNGIIRCVGDPYKRFDEDALRIMRAIRFSSQLDFYMERNTSNAIIEFVKNLNNISVERINSELCKILVSQNPEYIIFEEDILCQIIPEFKSCIDFEQNNPYHCFTVDKHIGSTLIFDKSDDLIVRLTLLFHDIGKPYCFQDGEDGIRHFKGHGRVSAKITDNIMKRLRFDNDTRNKVVELVHYHDATFEVGKKYVKRWLNMIGEEQFRRLLEVRKADIKGQKADYKQSRIDKVNNIENILEEVLQEDECFSLKDLAVNGKDLMKVGYKAGKELGNTLNELLQLVIDNECLNEKELLLKIAERRMQ